SGLSAPSDHAPSDPSREDSPGYRRTSSSLQLADSRRFSVGSRLAGGSRRIPHERLAVPPRDGDPRPDPPRLSAPGHAMSVILVTHVLGAGAFLPLNEGGEVA